MIRNKGRNSGFIALISVIIISVLLITITAAVSLSGYFARFNVLDSEYKERSIALAEACADTAILRLAQDSGYHGPDTVNVGSDVCTILSVESNGSEFIIKTQAAFPLLTSNSSEHAFTNMEVIVQSNDFSILSWKETLAP